MAGKALSSLNIGFIDPDSLRLYAERKPRHVNSAIEEHIENDHESRKAMFVQTAVDLAFTFNSQKQRDYVIHALSDGHRIHSQNLPVGNAKELLMSAHIIELGSASANKFAFKITPTSNRVQTDYFEHTDEFTIELMQHVWNSWPTCLI